MIRGFSFSLKRLLGITTLKQQVAKKIGIPLTKHGLERKVGSKIISLFKNSSNK